MCYLILNFGYLLLLLFISIFQMNNSVINFQLYDQKFDSKSKAL
jgi:hypothetical protein